MLQEASRRVAASSAATVWRPVAMDEDHGPTSFSITRTRALLFSPLDSHRHGGGGPCPHSTLLFSSSRTATEGGVLMGARLATPPSQLLRGPDKAEAVSVNSPAS